MIGVREVQARLRAAADPDRAEHSAGYTPTAMKLLGVPVPACRAIAREIAKERKGAPPEQVIELAQQLVDTGGFDARQVGYLVFERHKPALAALTRKQIEALGAGIDNWASVDCFGVTIAGPAWRAGQLTDAAIFQWARSKDLWWRRLALVCTVALNAKTRGGAGDPERTIAVCELLADDHEDMIAKALSWALRKLGERDPAPVRAFLAEHEAVLAKRVLREVRTKLTTGKKNPKQ